MGMVVSGKGGIVVEVNVVPLIDILLVLLVIFMVMPHKQMGLQAELPSQVQTPPVDPPETVVVRLAPDGAIWVSQSAVQLVALRDHLEKIFALREHRVAFLQSDRSLEFQAVAQVLDLMH